MQASGLLSNGSFVFNKLNNNLANQTTGPKKKNDNISPPPSSVLVSCFTHKLL